MINLPPIVPTLRNLFAKTERTTLRGIAPEPNVQVPSEERWEDETPLPKITRDEVRSFFGWKAKR